MQALGRPANFSVTVNAASEVAALPWFGNYASDAPLFQAVENYVQCRCTSAEDAISALQAMSIHGMGIHDVVTIDVLKAHLEECDITPLHFDL